MELGLADTRVFVSAFTLALIALALTIFGIAAFLQVAHWLKKFFRFMKTKPAERKKRKKASRQSKKKKAKR